MSTIAPRPRASRKRRRSPDAQPLLGSAAPPLPDWVILLGLVLIVASDYKFRRRTLGDSLGGSLDLMVMVEIGCYAIVGAVLVVHHLQWGQKLRGTPVMVALWAYGGIMAASAVYAPFPNLAMVRAVQLLLIIAFGHVLAERATPEQYRNFARWFIALMLVSILVGLAYVAPTSNYQEGRFTWLHTHTVTAASLLCVALLLTVGLLTIKPRVPRSPWASMLLVGCALVLGVFLLMTKTRGSMAGAVVGLIVYAVLRVHKSQRNGVMFLMALGLGGVLYFALPLLESFVTRGESAESVATLSNRTALWSVAWVDFQQKPLFGWGLTASRGLFFEAVQLGGAHNAAINAAVDGGLVGLTAWLTFLVVLGFTIRRAWRTAPAVRPELALCTAVLVTMLVNSLTMEGIGSGAGGVFILLCMLAGWVVTLQRSAPTQTSPTSDPGSSAGSAATPGRRLRSVER